jgi:hypothetical protein
MNKKATRSGIITKLYIHEGRLLSKMNLTRTKKIVRSS